MSSFDHVQFPVEGVIKSILPNSEGDHLVVDTVDYDNESQQLSLLDLSDFSIVHQLNIEKEYQILNLKTYNSNSFAAIGFTQNTNPDLADVYVFDWEKTSPTFATLNSKIIGYDEDSISIPHRNFENKTTTISLNTGEECQPVDPVSRKTNEVIFPVAYDQQSEFFELFIKLLSAVDQVPVGVCEYYQSNDKILISYYVVTNHGMENCLVVLSSEGEFLNKYLLDEGLKGFGKDTFFIIKNKVIFVSEKNTLNVVTI